MARDAWFAVDTGFAIGFWIVVAYGLVDGWLFADLGAAALFAASGFLAVHATLRSVRGARERGDDSDSIQDSDATSTESNDTDDSIPALDADEIADYDFDS